MKMLDRLMLAVSPETALKRARARILFNHAQNLLNKHAAYDGAGNGRRGWRNSGGSQNIENRRSLKHLRENARELERNNPYVTTAVNVIDSYTVGTGIVPKAKHVTGHKRKIKLADDLMREWMNSTEIDYAGQLNLFGLQGLSMRTIALSGESLFVKRVATDRNLAVPLRIQLMEGDYIDDSRDTLSGLGDEIIQGVECRSGRAVKYHLFGSHPSEGGSVFGSNPVDAALVAHAFEVLRPGQVRGLPHGYSVFTKMKSLDDFDDAFVELQRMAACFGAFVWSDDPASGGDSGSPLPEEMEPQTITKLTGSERVAFSTPPTVSGQEPFAKSIERRIASAYGISYSALTGDFSEGNFAAEKMARIQMYMNVARWRRRMIVPMQMKKIEAWWLEAAAIKGHDLEGISFDWTPPKREILDLKNELPAIIQKIRAGLGSLQGELREWGIDANTLINELAEDRDLLKKLGLILDSDASQTSRAGQLQVHSNPDMGVKNNMDSNDED